MRSSFLFLFLAVAASYLASSGKAGPLVSKKDQPIRIKRVVEADPYFRLVEVDAVLFQYTGGRVEVWLEETVNGRRKEWGKQLNEVLQKSLLSSHFKGAPSKDELQKAMIESKRANAGYVVLTRHRLQGKEQWDLKLTVNPPKKEQLGVKLPGTTFGLSGKSQAVIVDKTGAAEEVTEETDLLTVSEDTPHGRLIVRLKCRPWKDGPR
jgi:hypothetical protein